MDTIKRKFWLKIDRRSSNDCWNYKGYLNPDGYGIFKIGKTKIYAHRLAWEFFNKCRIPKGKKILHKCDNPSCCSPAHLYCGTQEDNMQDRAARGKRGMLSKLHSGEIWLIRKLKILKQKDIGRYNSTGEFVGSIFRVSRRTVGNIWRLDKFMCKEGYYT